MTAVLPTTQSDAERWEEAIACWDKSTELKPNFRDAWINKGTALQKLGRYAEAISANNHAIALGDNTSPSEPHDPGVSTSID